MVWGRCLWWGAWGVGYGLWDLGLGWVVEVDRKGMGASCGEACNLALGGEMAQAEARIWP